MGTEVEKKKKPVSQIPAVESGRKGVGKKLLVTPFIEPNKTERGGGGGSFKR